VKAEAAKLPGAGISPKPCPRKSTAEKGHAPHSVRNGAETREQRRERKVASLSVEAAVEIARLTFFDNLEIRSR